MNAKKAQAWGFDLMIAAIIFTFAIVLFYVFSINNSHDTQEIIDSLSYDGSNIADNLVSAGYPSDWNSSNVAKIGLLTDDKIDESKLSQFQILALSDYQRTKSLLDSANDYYITFSENITINGTAIEFIGNKNDNSKNLIRTTRMIVYKEKPVAIYINVWS